MSKVFAGATIRMLRDLHGLTQLSMARKLGISTSYLNQIENDNRALSASMLLNLARTFDVDPSLFSPEEAKRNAGKLKDALALAGITDFDERSLRDLSARYPKLAATMSQLAYSQAPVDQVDAYEHVKNFLFSKRNHVEELDELAEKLAKEIGIPGLRVTRLSSLLDQEFSVTVSFHKELPTSRRSYNPATRTVYLRNNLNEAQQCFELARQVAHLRYEDVLVDLTHDSPWLPDEQSRALAHVALAQYFGAAVVMPYGDFIAAARELHYDIDLLSSRFGTSFESTCHRLSTLQRPGDEGVPFFFIRTDRAGNISKRQSSASFHFSRSGGSCPLWVLHRSFESSGRILRQVAQMPDGRTYLWIARTISSTSFGFGEAPKEFAIGLGCDIDQAENLVYSRGLNLSPDVADPIGTGCRVCSREDCRQRAFPFTGRELATRESESSDIPYS
ncbi:helix-turn-helix domain-containing protein [Corynebacterium vitaeruminis]|uniref:HTH cro/C1-type domain-containing protein n=1 Tax=Corynebacterium vitaeruminis DSM 20294 TaxID=1224164 RepID=W5XZV7_9CORY|nr:short-chain fatty acyl-CoA regulator family protein [Corynebacterium vitaeruminis]AHI22511.1 hypothetical protein B843_05630 [Corynebacterium vitaeruminis DSM 20294]